MYNQGKDRDEVVLGEIGPKPNDWCPHRNRRGHMEDRRPGDGGGRDWSAAAISYGTPGATRAGRNKEGSFPRAS